MPKFTNPFLQTRLQPFLCLLATTGLLGLLAVFGPHQLPVVAYKLVMPLLGGFAGCFAWLTMLPYANPSRYLVWDWRKDPESNVDGKPDFPVAPGSEHLFCVATICMTAAVCCGMLAVAWGL